MARLCINTSSISSSSPFSPAYDFNMLSSPINVNAIARILRRQHKVEEDDEVASIITLSADEVLGDGEKSGHSLVRMECLSASSGSNYSPFDFNEDAQYHPPVDASEGQEPRGTLGWAPLNQSIDYPESVGWDSNSETQYSYSEAHSSSASVGYVKIALSSEIKSSSGKAFLPRQVRPTHPVIPLIPILNFTCLCRTSPRQIIYHSPTLPTHPDLDCYDAPDLDSVMLKRAETLQEVSMVECLNSEELRRDPWNPVVPLLAVVNANEPDDETAVLILERLQPYDAVPCKTVRDVVDLIRQVLQVCKRPEV